jgi:hypothetical protein
VISYNFSGTVKKIITTAMLNSINFSLTTMDFKNITLIISTTIYIYLNILIDEAIIIIIITIINIIINNNPMVITNIIIIIIHTSNFNCNNIITRTPTIILIINYHTVNYIVLLSSSLKLNYSQSIKKKYCIFKYLTLKKFN